MATLKNTSENEQICYSVIVYTPYTKTLTNTPYRRKVKCTLKMLELSSESSARNGEKGRK